MIYTNPIVDSEDTNMYANVHTAIQRGTHNTQPVSLANLGGHSDPVMLAQHPDAPC